MTMLQINISRLDRSFAKYFYNKAPLRKPPDDDATDQYKTALKVSKKVLDVSTKDTESPLYDDRSQRYFEGISEASQEQNLPKDSESTGEDLPEKLEDLNSPPTHIRSVPRAKFAQRFRINWRRFTRKA
ncbi:hypothetical protein QE152_g15492 [Popillia japonica]|uniref:Uncharacterized protein n=1 Tax=Popillia japonica TaxID=7064 RepID=A0AAW1L8C4_POPJA